MCHQKMPGGRLLRWLMQKTLAISTAWVGSVPTLPQRFLLDSPVFDSLEERQAKEQAQPLADSRVDESVERP